MNSHLDQKFILQVKNLITEVLTDESRFFHKNDQQFATLHNKIFSKTEETPFASLQKADKDLFKKYFYVGNNIYTPRADMPFGDSPEDQAFFFDSFHQQLKTCTYNFDKMAYLRPEFAEKATDPSFNPDQLALLTRGLIYPLIYNVEQKAIADQEKKESPNITTEKDNKANPYDQLADKMLVQGESGEFDVILTYAQLEEIAQQEDQLRKDQTLDNTKVVALLKEYIGKRFPHLQIKLTKSGKVTTFQDASGFSAGGNLDDQEMQKDPSKLPAPILGGQSFSELLKEMKLRQGKKMQYETIISSDYKVSLSPADFQLETTTRKGLSVHIQGENAVFFVIDQQGVAAKVIVDTSAYRNGEKPNFNLHIYRKPQEDSPVNPKITLNKDELPKLQTPLLVLYGQLLEPSATEEKAGENPKSNKPLELSNKSPNSGESPNSSAGEILSSLELEFSSILSSKSAPMPESGPGNPKTTAATGLENTRPSTFTMPKLSSAKGQLTVPKPATPQQTEEQQEEQPENPNGLIPKEGTPGKLPEAGLKTASASKNPKKPLIPKGLKVPLTIGLAIGLPIASSLALATTQMILNASS